MIPIRFINKSKKKGKPTVILLGNKSVNTAQFAQPPFNTIASITGHAIVKDATGRTILEMDDYNSPILLDVLQRRINIIQQQMQPFKQEYNDIVARIRMMENNHDNRMDVLDTIPQYRALRRKYYELRDFTINNENRLRALIFLMH